MEKKNLQKAFELRDHVSIREKYLIEAEFYSISEKTFDLAIEAFSNLITAYPDEIWGRHDLGFTYFEIEDWDKSIEQYSKSMEIKDTSIIPYHVMTLAYCAKGTHDKAIELLNHYLDTHPDDSNIHQYLASIYICLGKLDDAFIEVKTALALNPKDYVHVMTQGDIYLYKGELNKAETEYHKILENDEPLSIMYGMRRLASLYLLQGRLEDSYQKAKDGLKFAEKLNDTEGIRQWLYVLSYLDLTSGSPNKALQKLQKVCEIADEVADLKYQREALHMKAIAYLKSDLLNQAQKASDELTALVQNLMNKKKLRLCYHLIGLMELKKENLAKAIPQFEKALTQLPFQYHPRYGDNHALFMDPLACSCYKSGDLERAQEEYKKIVSLTSGRLHHGDIYAKAFYMLGQIYEEKGWEGKAIDHYEKFLDLWKNADPDIAEVEDARSRLVKLKN